MEMYLAAITFHQSPYLAWQGFGSRVLAYDIREDPAAVALGVEYVPKERVLREADILSLHCPLLPSTYHIIDADRCLPNQPRWHVFLVQGPTSFRCTAPCGRPHTTSSTPTGAAPLTLLACLHGSGADIPSVHGSLRPPANHIVGADRCLPNQARPHVHIGCSRFFFQVRSYTAYCMLMSPASALLHRLLHAMPSCINHTREMSTALSWG